MIYPIAHDAVRRLGTLFEIERSINGKPATNRLAVRQELSARLMAEIHVWLVGQRAGLLRNHDFTGASQLHAAPLGCIHALPRGRIGRHPARPKAWLFCGLDRGGRRAALLYAVIQTARLNNVDPQAWVADVLARIADHPAARLDELLSQLCISLAHRVNVAQNISSSPVRTAKDGLSGTSGSSAAATVVARVLPWYARNSILRACRPPTSTCPRAMPSA
jgi:hypothetical protein